MSNLSDLSDFPTYIGVIPNQVEDEVLFVVRDPSFKNEHYNIITKPSMGKILFHGDHPYAIEQEKDYSFEQISIGNFIKGLIYGHAKYTDILANVKRFQGKRNYFRQYVGCKEIVDGCIDKKKVYTTLDFILLLDKTDKLNEGILKYLLEVEYGIRQVEMVELFNLTCTKFNEND